MSPWVASLAVVLFGVVALVISAPLRRREAPGEGAVASRQPGGESVGERALQVARDELEAARETKYREIRDCELDYRTGKLSREDFEATDAQLRAEALEILNRVEQLDHGHAGGD